jgi:streptogramin lyase
MDCVVCFKNGAWERLTEVGTISISKDGTRWFLSTKDKALAGMKGTTLELVPVPANCQYGTFFIDPADAKWIYRNDTLYALKADQWLPIVIPPTFRSTSYYSFLKVDDAGNIWLSGQNYLLRYSPVQNEWKSFPVVVNATSQYSGILRMAIDAENHLWTVYSNGVNYFDSSTWKFYNPISEGGYTRGIELDKQGRLNVTSWQNSNTNSLILYSAIKKERNADGFWTANQCTCESNACNNSCFNPADNSWIYLTNTYSFGFRLFLVRDGHSQLLPYPENDSTKLLAGLDVTDNGTLWAQTKGNSLLRYRNGKWENLNIDKSLNPDTITGILGAGGDTVWIGTGKAGLARFDGASWQKFETKLGDKSLLLPLYYDCKRNELWCKILLKCQTFNTFSFKLGQTYVNDGLYCFNGTTGTQHTTVNSGIYDSYITSVAPDQNGIWVASNYGLAYWDRSASVTTLPGSRKTDKFVKMTHRTTYVTINNVLKFHLNTPGTVILSIYNMSGQLIRTEDIGKRNAGLNLIRLSDFNADDYAQNMFIVDVVVKR